MIIAFIHPHKAFLPEIAAYTAFFNNYTIQTIIRSPQEAPTLQADVEWYFMGRADKNNSPAVVIHEYPSASTPPLGALKNSIKRLLTPKPAFRLFQNEYVAASFRFSDGIPFGIRPHGFTPVPTAAANTPKPYDFIYIGTVDKARQLDGLFTAFISGPLRDHTLLILSQDYQALQKQLGDPSNIHFKGPVPPSEVPGYIRQASYGINFIPDKAPYNSQPSGKFLDYCACALPVITTDYPWIRDFQRQAGGTYYYLQPDLSNFSWDEITRFDYHSPNLTGWTWEEQIRKSGVLEFLQSRFPELSF